MVAFLASSVDKSTFPSVFTLPIPPFIDTSSASFPSTEQLDNLNKPTLSSTQTTFINTLSTPATSQSFPSGHTPISYRSPPLRTVHPTLIASSPIVSSLPAPISPQLSSSTILILVMHIFARYAQPEHIQFSLDELRNMIMEMLSDGDLMLTVSHNIIEKDLTAQKLDVQNNGRLAPPENGLKNPISSFTQREYTTKQRNEKNISDQQDYPQDVSGLSKRTGRKQRQKRAHIQLRFRNSYSSTLPTDGPNDHRQSTPPHFLEAGTTRLNLPQTLILRETANFGVVYEGRSKGCKIPSTLHYSQHSFSVHSHHFLIQHTLLATSVAVPERLHYTQTHHPQHDAELDNLVTGVALLLPIDCPRKKERMDRAQPNQTRFTDMKSTPANDRFQISLWPTLETRGASSFVVEVIGKLGKRKKDEDKKKEEEYNLLNTNIKLIHPLLM
ncbi:hypothetical protein BLNAU_19688 [Blattamonas nauphoetae]|uniref:Uncharacterized protein n=1 Tax=Blattamonas nauphoetae TaxID=2049346 RepID=A0ABQ9X0Q7_9EUKA|nr:hypothetical protein BLNAU_19688 [Blattamonas nauphoetae]